MTPNDTAKTVISAIVVCSFIGVTIGWLISPPHVENSQTLSLLTGALINAFGQVVNAYLNNRTPPQ